jgi:endothelin-converting enzyme/putative endopeptidase
VPKIPTFSILILAACATAAPPAATVPSPPLRVEQGKPTAELAATAPAPAVPGIDSAAVDPGVSPCADFFSYACGGWIAANPIPADRSRWGTFDKLRETNLERLRDILEAQAAGKADPEDLFGRKAGDYYAACMDEGGIEKRGLADLRAEWRKVEGVKDARALAAAAGRLQAQGVGVLFGIRSTQDSKDSTKVIAGIGQSGLSLPDRDYYLKDDARSADIRKAFLAHLEKMLTLTGERPAQATKESKAIFALEKAMAESHWTRVERRDPVRTYNPHDLAALQKRTPRYPWKAYLGALGAPDVRSFDVQTPQALSRLDELLGKIPFATWRAYLRWHVLRDLASARAVPRAFVEESFAFTSRSFTGAKELEPRWKACVRATDGALGDAVGQAFARRYFGGDARDQALTLVRGIQAAQGRNLDSLAWMDDPTRAKAQDKLARVDNKIGYPSRWRDYASLEVTRGSYLRSALAAEAFESRRDLAKIGKPLDRTEWEMTTPTVNAYYSPPMNEMVFPAGILQNPFYTPGANDAVNYGAAGFVVGHELTHGFDDQGRKFDAQGNLVDWWSPAVGQDFEKRAACVDQQYAGYVAVGDVRVDGKLTLGENIADLGGLKLALAAYRASRKGKPPEAVVAGLSPDQQFFVAAAQVWCGHIRPEQARLLAQVDPHSPARWRVDGPLSNLPEFAAAFGCKAGDPMVRAERCEVW